MKLDDKMYGIDTKLILASLKRWNIHLSSQVSHILLDVVGDAVVKYDKSKDMSLQSWAAYYVPRNLKKAVEKEQRQGGVSLDTIRGNDDTTLHALIPSNAKSVEAIVIENDTKARMKEAISQLDAEGQFIVKYVLRELDQGNERWRASLAVALSDAGFYKKPITREWARQKSKKYMEQIRQAFA